MPICSGCGKIWMDQTRHSPCGDLCLDCYVEEEIRSVEHREEFHFIDFLSALLPL